MNFNKPGIIPIFVPHLGCPHDCVFCNQKSITGQQRAYDTEQVISDIDAHLETMKGKRHPLEIAFFGGSFTGIPVHQQIELLDIARRYLDDGHIHGIRLSTRPDYIDQDILDRLLEFGVTTVELGVQSMDQAVLQKSERGHTTRQVETAVRLIKKTRLKLGLQMMLGLPGDTLDKSLETALKIVALKPDFVRIYPTVVIADTELESMYRAGTYEELTVEQAACWLSKLMPVFTRSGIPIIRVGLQPTDTLTNGDSRVAGAYHPSMRQLAESIILFNRIDAIVSKIKKEEPICRIQLSAREQDWTVVRGQKRTNFNALEAQFSDVEWSFEISETVERRTVQLLISKENSVIYEAIKID